MFSTVTRHINLGGSERSRKIVALSPTHIMSSYSNVAAAGSSCLRIVSGVWTKKSDETAPSLETTEIVARAETTPPDYSLPAHPHTAHSVCHESRNTPNILENTLTDASGLEAHRPLSVATISPPPPYAPHDYELTEKQAEVSSVVEPSTLARMFFIYGFFFFPFWFVGIYILCSPLQPTPDWETGKTEAEKLQLLHILREAEIKWGRRCLYVLFGFAVTVFLLVIIIKYSMGSGV